MEIERKGFLKIGFRQKTFGRSVCLIKRKTSHQKLGFSLLELMVVVVLLGLIISISIPSLRSLTGVQIKSSITELAGLTSEVYNRAQLLGKTHRIVFDLANNEYWVEEKEAEATEISPELGYEELLQKSIDRAQEKRNEQETFLPKFKKVKERIGEIQKLPSGLIIYGVWTSEMEEIKRDGVAAIYFFSGGYAQKSFVSITQEGDEENSSMYLSLSPLTGLSSIELGEPIPSELLEEEAL